MQAQESSKSFPDEESVVIQPVPDDESVVPRPVARVYWQQAFDTGAAPFAKPDRRERILSELNKFIFERASEIRISFSNETGLIRLLRGNLVPDQRTDSPEAMIKVSRDFLQEHQSLLFGTDKDKDKYEYRLETDRHSTIGSVSRFRQTDQAGIPVYGARVICGFNNVGALTIINNSWYPLPPDKDYSDYFKVSEKDAAEIAKEHIILPNNNKEVSGVPPPPSPKYLEVIPHPDFEDGRVILPYRGDYKPTWAILVSEQHELQRGWEVMVDASEGEVLQVTKIWVGATLRGKIYRNNQKALDGDYEEEDVDLGDKDSLDNADDFPINDETNRSFRSFNTYYHLRHAERVFRKIVDRAWPNQDQSDPPKVPGKENKLPVQLHGAQTGGNYNYKHTPPTLDFGIGDPGFNPPVKDPVFDCEVIYHEYTHAILHNTQPDIFIGPYPFSRSINEGLAFYYGCTLSEAPHQDADDEPATPSRWGEYAYRGKKWKWHRSLQRENAGEQTPNHDFLPVYGVFPNYQNKEDPVDNSYACGMLWARVLWDIRRELGYEIANAIILRAMNLAGGINSELETPAELIIHVDEEDDSGGPSHGNALRAIFYSRGIMADGPIHDLLAIELDNQTTYILAATENGGRDDACGCLFSKNNGDTWESLGRKGPAEVVALAAVEIPEDNKVLIWAASEFWEFDESDSTVKPTLYQYELSTDSPDTNADWTKLPRLPSLEQHPPPKNKNLNIFSLAATRKPDSANDEFMLFVGTEIGLYKYDSDWSKIKIFQQVIFDLAITAEDSARLLAATTERLRILNPDDMNESPAPDTGKDNLAVATRAGHIWVGTAFKGLYHFDPNNNWEHVNGTFSKPIHSLWVAPPDPSDTTWTLYAGTNDGVYRREGDGDWEPFNQRPGLNGEAIEKTSVSALCQVGDTLFAGTAQRGLWRRNLSDPNDSWEHLTQGLPRLGRLVDVNLPVNANQWSDDQFATGDLPSNGVGTHVLYVPHSAFGLLSFKVIEGEVTLKLFYVPPHIDLNPANINLKYAAGLQSRTLDNGVMVESVKPGYYVLTVRAVQAGTTYRVRGELAQQPISPPT